jgi:hypothetical protein
MKGLLGTEKKVELETKLKRLGINWALEESNDI